MVAANLFGFVFSQPKKIRRVQRLYRSCLRTVRDWSIGIDIFEAEASAVRNRFEALRHETNALRIQQAMADARSELKSRSHPSPYTSESHLKVCEGSLQFPIFLLLTRYPETQNQSQQFPSLLEVQCT